MESRVAELPSEVSTDELHALLSWFAAAARLGNAAHPDGDARSDLGARNSPA